MKLLPNLPNSTLCCIRSRLDSNSLVTPGNIVNATKACFQEELSFTSQWNYIFYHFFVGQNQSVSEKECLSITNERQYQHSSIFLIVWILTMVATVLCNFLLIVSIIQSTILKKHIANSFILSLAVSDFCVGCFVLPFKVKTGFDDMKFMLQLRWCKLYITADNIFFTVSIANLFIISVDRYIALKFSYKYPNLMTHTNSRIVIVFAWLYGMVWGLLVNINWNNKSEPSIMIEKNACLVDNRYYVIVVFVVSFLFPLSTIGYMYMEVLSIARSHVLTIKSFSKGFEDLPPPPSTTNPETVTINTTNSPTRVSFKNKLLSNVLVQRVIGSSPPSSPCLSPIQNDSNNNAKKKSKSYKKMRLKATKTVAVVYGTFVISWAPVWIISLILVICHDCFKEKRSEWYYNIMIEVLPFMSSLLNPFIYGVMNRQYRQALRSLLQRYGFCKVVRAPDDEKL